MLPILGALPDALLVLVSGLGGTPAEAQEQVTSLSSSGRQRGSDDAGGTVCSTLSFVLLYLSFLFRSILLNVTCAQVP